MKIKEFINFVIDLGNDEMAHKLDGAHAKIYFTTGCGSLELAEIIKHYYPEGCIMVNKNVYQYGIKYSNIIYNANGIVNNVSDYRIATSDDILYTKETLKLEELNPYSGENIPDHLINEIPKCNILSKLEK